MLLRLIVAAVMAVATKVGSDNTGNDIENAGFGGGISQGADVPDWLRTLIDKAISQYGCPEVTPALLAAQLYQESGFDPKIQSFKTVEKDGKKVKVPVASGIAQFIPGTWTTHGKDGDGDGDKDVFDPADAVPAAVDYDCDIAKDVRNVPGDKADNMLAAYNAGPYAVKKYGGSRRIRRPRTTSRSSVALPRSGPTPWPRAARCLRVADGPDKSSPRRRRRWTPTTCSEGTAARRTPRATAVTAQAS